MVLTPEIRRSPRYEIILPLRIVSVGRRSVNLLGQTRDLSSGGVRFIIPNKFRIGQRIEYIITRSSGTQGTEIRCFGNVLRCGKKYDCPSYDVIASIDSEMTGQRYETEFGFEKLEDLSLSVSSTYSSIDADRYRPMLRLLSDEDHDFVSDPALCKKLRIRRCDLFREFLGSLTEDYRVLLSGVRLLMAESGNDRPDLAKALVRNRVSFAVARCRIEVRLRLYALGIGQTDVLRLEIQGLASALDVLRRQFSFLAESAVWGG